MQEINKEIQKLQHNLILKICNKLVIISNIMVMNHNFKTLVMVFQDNYYEIININIINHNTNINFYTYINK